MAIDTHLTVPTFEGSTNLHFKSGTSLVFIGANGAGKTRLGVLIDRQLSQKGIEAHRIAAHRSLTLNPNVVPPNLEMAEKRLRFGGDKAQSSSKEISRWGQKPETFLLNDFDHVLSALYAENNDISVSFRQSSRENPANAALAPEAKIDKLKSIWESVLPHRHLVILGGNIKTKTIGSEYQEYSASDMSDGERVIFYLIGQSLLAQKDAVLIFDEPELHINKSVLAKLWDEIESARPDCAFLYITHDIDFSASRHAATKFALRAYRKLPKDAWDIESIPDDSQLPDDIVATIVGSRRPVLFVEGDGGSLDSALYRRVYNTLTVVPVGSCEKVIRTVAAFAARPELHRVGCAGIVDADGRTDEEAAFLETRGVYRLPVSEVENLMLLPGVFLALAASLQFSVDEAQDKMAAIRAFVFAQASQQIDEVCLRYTKRRVDAEMKKIGLSGANIAALNSAFREAAGSIDPSAIFSKAKANLNMAISSQDYEKVLLIYDNKGLLSEVAKQLGFAQKAFEEFMGRTLRSDTSSVLHSALQDYLPAVVPRP